MQCIALENVRTIFFSKMDQIKALSSLKMVWQTFKDKKTRESLNNHFVTITDCLSLMVKSEVIAVENPKGLDGC